MSTTTFEEFKNYFFTQVRNNFIFPEGLDTNPEVETILANQYKYIDLNRRYPSDDVYLINVTRIGDTSRALKRFFPPTGYEHDYSFVIYNIINRKINNSETSIKADIKRALANTIFKYTVLNDDKFLAEAAIAVMTRSNGVVDSAFDYHVGKITFDQLCLYVSKSVYSPA